MRNKRIGIYFIASLVLPILVTLALLHQQRHLVRKQVKRRIEAGISKDELVVLTFTNEEIKSDLNWKHYKEFSYKNQFYDIVYREVHDDSTTFYCWWDHEENSLNKKLDQMLKLAMGQDPYSKHHQSKLDYFLKTLYSSQHYFPIVLPRVIICNYSSYKILWKDITILVQTPPPEFV